MKEFVKRKVADLGKGLTPTRKKLKVAGTLVADLVVSPLAKIGRAAKELADHDRKERVDRFARYLRTGEPADYGTGTVEDALFPQVAKAMLEDEETGKEWAYAGLVRAFAAGTFAPSQRIRILRAVRDVLNEELIRFIELGPNVSHMTVALTNANGPSEGQAMIQAMSRWGILHPAGGRIRDPKNDPQLFPVLMQVLVEAWDRAHATDAESPAAE